MGRSKLAIAALLFSASAMAQVQVWNQDLNGSTNANKIVSGIQNHAIAAPTSAGGLYWSGTTWLYTSGVPAVCGGDLVTSGGVCGAVQSLTPTGGLSTIVPFNAGGFKLATTPWVLQDSGSVTRFSLETAHGRGTFGGGGSDFKTVCGPLVGNETTASACWALANATSPSATNYYVKTDGAFVYFNDAFGSGMFFYDSGVTQMAALSTSQLSLWSGVLTITDSATPTIQSGTSATSLGVGTTKAGAEFDLFADANSKVLAMLLASATFQSGVNVNVTAAYEDVSAMTAPSAGASGHQRIYTDTADNKLKVVDAAGNIFTLAP